MEEEPATTQKGGFIKHVFNFDNDTKSEVLNIVQYAVLAIIPMALFNYAVDSVIPESDESKGNLEILGELVGQLIIVLLGVFLIHRIVTFVPTYSGRAFGEMNLFSIILVLLVLGYESGTKVGEKTKILLKRLKELWEGKKDDKDKQKQGGKGTSVVKVSQPISRAGMPTHAPSRADYLQSHNQLVSPTQMLPPATKEGMQANSGASNSIYNDAGFGGLVDASTPGQASVPRAANEGFGAFSSF